MRDSGITIAITDLLPINRVTFSAQSALPLCVFTISIPLLSPYLCTHTRTLLTIYHHENTT